MWDALLWVYLANAVLLVVHEIDAAYWKEWKLFGLPGGVSAFLLLHVPLVAALLVGLVLVERRLVAGLVLSLLAALSGMLAFTIHVAFILKGHREFNAAVSLAVLFGTLLVSLVQAALSITLLAV
jgi:hypothetical protein